MGRKSKYTEEFKNTIVELYKSGKSVSELSVEYDIPKSTICTWTKENSRVVPDNEDSMTLKEFKELKKEMNRIKTENEILKKAMAILVKD